MLPGHWVEVENIRPHGIWTAEFEEPMVKIVGYQDFEHDDHTIILKWSPVGGVQFKLTCSE